MNYIDISNQYTNKKHYQLKKQKYFIGADGAEYRVDGHYVILKPTPRASSYCLVDKLKKFISSVWIPN